MKLATYQIEQRARLGVISADGQRIFPITAMGVEYGSMMEAVCQMSESEKQLLEYASRRDPEEVLGSVALSEVELLAPIVHPAQDIICLGINYMAHAEESARYKKEAFGGERPYAVYFSKRVNAAVGNGQPIDAHADIVSDLDYEVELAVVIGKDAYRVSEEQAQEYIFGYTIINDVSARTIQTNHKQWYFGKSLDGFTPMGPVIVTADALPYPPKLQIRSYVNGELRQDSNTGLLLFGISHIISELSQGMTLKAGTIISTGTPAGVGMGFTPPKFLKPGDVVACEIEGIGVLENPVV